MNKFLPVAIFIFFIGVIFSASAKINMFPKPRYIPAISFYSESGKAYKLTDFQEDLLMAVVWSKNCVPCLEDLRNLKKFVQKTADKGIKVILISPEKDFRTADERRYFLNRIGAPNVVNYVDRNANFRDGMGIMVTPTAILVNRNGEEAGQITGSIKWDDSDVIEYMLNLKDKLLEQL